MQYKYRLSHDLSVPAYALSLAKAAIIRTRDTVTPVLNNGFRYVFIAGCGHSGTTLMAARFGNLPGAYVVPKETYIFRPEKSLASATKDLTGWAQTARELGQSAVVEKTPKHIHCWDRIQRLIPDAKLIVMVRNPLDTCASIKKRIGSLDYAIDRYCIDNTAAVELQGARNVLHVAYEKFVTEPEVVGKAIVEFADLTWDDAFAIGGTATFDKTKLTHNMLLRQQQVREPIKAHIGGWKSSLAQAEADEVLARTGNIARRLGVADFGL